MAKLSDVKTHTAWEDFKNYLIQLGFLSDDPSNPKNKNKNLAQMAFKQGFVAGTNHANTDYNQETHTKTGITRNVETRVNRTEEQLQEDNRLIEQTLQFSIDPMQLSDIIKHMRQENKRLHWNNNNASGFMKTAIRKGCNISRVSRGVYTYDWKGEKDNGQ